MTRPPEQAWENVVAWCSSPTARVQLSQAEIIALQSIGGSIVLWEEKNRDAYKPHFLHNYAKIVGADARGQLKLF